MPKHKLVLAASASFPHNLSVCQINFSPRVFVFLLLVSRVREKHLNTKFENTHNSVQPLFVHLMMVIETMQHIHIVDKNLGMPRTVARFPNQVLSCEFTDKNNRNRMRRARQLMHTTQNVNSRQQPAEELILVILLGGAHV